MMTPDLPPWILFGSLLVAVLWTIAWGWLVKLSLYDWDDFSNLAQLGLAASVTLLSVPLSVFLVGVVGFFHGLSLF